jgi:hypothetical protein
MIRIDRILLYRGLSPCRYSPISFACCYVLTRVAPPLKFNIVARDGVGMWSCDKDARRDVMFQIVLFTVYTTTRCIHEIWSDKQTCCIRLSRV